MNKSEILQKLNETSVRLYAQSFSEITEKQAYKVVHLMVGTVKLQMKSSIPKSGIHFTSLVLPAVHVPSCAPHVSAMTSRTTRQVMASRSTVVGTPVCIQTLQ